MNNHFQWLSARFLSLRTSIKLSAHNIYRLQQDSGSYLNISDGRNTNQKFQCTLCLASLFDRHQKQVTDIHMNVIKLSLHEIEVPAKKW